MHQDVVTVLKENVTLNEKYVPKKNIHIALLDFKSNEILANPAFLKNQVDVIIGSEIMYEVDITEALMKTINMYLKPNGHFYGISASYRKVCGLQGHFSH
jgi:2-polyprenyl-3-methyl-5-hydroxy-6-metoxy-1,4-benzoquinol methylase